MTRLYINGKLELTPADLDVLAAWRAAGHEGELDTTVSTPERDTVELKAAYHLKSRRIDPDVVIVHALALYRHELTSLGLELGRLIDVWISLDVVPTGRREDVPSSSVELTGIPGA